MLKVNLNKFSQSFAKMSLKSALILSILIILELAKSIVAEPKLEVLAAWKNMAFGFDTNEQEQEVLENGYYEPAIQQKPYDGDIYVTDDGRWRTFLSIPRITAGIPYTLAEVVDGNHTEKGPLLRAYPSADMHLKRSCDGIFSVLRIWVEADCHRLWVIDSARDFKPPPSYGPKTQICAPKLLVFNLSTDTLEFSYEIPASQYLNEASVFNGVILSPSSTCDKTYGYVTDARGPGLLIFEREGSKFESWRVYSNYFKADPAYFNASIANESFKFVDGLYTVAPSLTKKLLYFHPFASVTEYAIPLDLVNYKAIWQHQLELDFLMQAIGKRRSQSTIQALDAHDNLWFALLDPTLGIYCWNTNTSYEDANFKLVIADDEVFQYVVGLKIRNLPGLGESIIGTSNRKQKHSAGTVNPNEINYRMFVFSIEGTDCSTAASK